MKTIIVYNRRTFKYERRRRRWLFFWRTIDAYPTFMQAVKAENTDRLVNQALNNLSPKNPF